jgi:hypothetical protein
MLIHYESEDYASRGEKNVAFGATLYIEFRQTMLHWSTFLQQF